MKKVLMFFLVVAVILSQVFVSYGVNTNSTEFSDIDSSHWAYRAVKWMTQNKIIAGYPDNTFKPNNIITRAEFSKIMVVALNLETATPEKETFIDIGRNHWAFSSVESAKYYLTGFRSEDGDRFWPDRQAVREDMAVALVKAKKLQNQQADLSVLDSFSDKDYISSNLRKYVAIAVKNDIMKGNQVSNSDKKAFRPQNYVARAEAAVLIYNTLESTADGEKITYDKEEKIAIETSKPEMQEGGTSYNYPSPKVQGSIVDGKIVLSWTKAPDNGFQFYKVVISKNNTMPRYPQDGYLYYFTDINKLSCTIGTESYSGGDVEGQLIPGQKYYFSITSVFEGGKAYGNSIPLVYPAKQEPKPATNSETYKLEGKIVDGKIKLNWTPTTREGFHYYKVVISKYKSNPVYPQDGYLYYFTDRNQVSCMVDNSQGYNGGDFEGNLKHGQKYYFSITYVYGDKKISSNTVQLVYP